MHVFTLAQLPAQFTHIKLQIMLSHSIDKNSDAAMRSHTKAGTGGEPALRERWFGDLDDAIITDDIKVWPADLKDAACKNYSV